MMNRQNLVYGFEFDYEFVIYYNVGTESGVECFTGVIDWHWFLCFHMESGLLQFFRENNLINSFKESRAKLTVNIYTDTFYKKNQTFHG